MKHLVDQFMTQRVVTNDGYTINSLDRIYQAQRRFSRYAPWRNQKTDADHLGKTRRFDSGCGCEKFNKGIANSELVIFDGADTFRKLKKRLILIKRFWNFYQNSIVLAHCPIAN